MKMLEHPDIARLMRDGVPEEVPLFCPFCGEADPETFYFQKDGGVIGCSACIEAKDCSDTCPEDLRI